METIDFNSKSFNGFVDEEDILLDAGVLLAYLNNYDAWNETVDNLFQKHILNNDKVLFLYVNPCMINEVTNLVDKPFKQYTISHPEEKLTQNDADKAINNAINNLKYLIENDILLPLDGNKDTMKKQIELYNKLGSFDACYASIANEYGISFLTVDNRLVNNIKNNSEELKDINKVYYTIPSYMTYRINK